jgi:hypothetical protein
MLPQKSDFQPKEDSEQKLSPWLEVFEKTQVKQLDLLLLATKNSERLEKLIWLVATMSFGTFFLGVAQFIYTGTSISRQNVAIESLEAQSQKTFEAGEQSKKIGTINQRIVKSNNKTIEKILKELRR